MTIQLIDKIEGVAEGQTAEVKRDVGLEPTTTSTSSADSTAPLTGSTTADLGAQAKGVFDQVTSAVQHKFTQLTHTIDEKTATPEHPGLITQVTNAVHKGVEKVDAFLEEHTATPPPAIPTTTNTSPHPAPVL